VKKKKIEKELRYLQNRVSYLERHCEIRESKYVKFTHWQPVGKVTVPQEDGEPGSLIEKYLKRRIEKGMDI